MHGCSGQRISTRSNTMFAARLTSASRNSSQFRFSDETTRAGSASNTENGICTNENDCTSYSY